MQLYVDMPYHWRQTDINIMSYNLDYTNYYLIMENMELTSMYVNTGQNHSCLTSEVWQLVIL